MNDDRVRRVHLVCIWAETLARACRAA
jgi:hypothetical protein